MWRSRSSPGRTHSTPQPVQVATPEVTRRDAGRGALGVTVCCGVAGAEVTALADAGALVAGALVAGAELELVAGCDPVIQAGCDPEGLAPEACGLGGGMAWSFAATGACLAGFALGLACGFGAGAGAGRLGSWMIAGRGAGAAWVAGVVAATAGAALARATGACWRAAGSAGGPAGTAPPPATFFIGAAACASAGFLAANGIWRIFACFFSAPRLPPPRTSRSRGVSFRRFLHASRSMPARSATTPFSFFNSWNTGAPS